jgi:uncharacterized protein GlcG (DUF336 family)
MQSISLEKAKNGLARALDLAEKRFSARPICISVCDAYGLPVAFLRMDGAPLRCINISRQKAYTSVRMGSSTAAFGLRLKQEEVLACDFCDSGLTPLAGGHPIKNMDGAIIGGIGISGLKPEEDDAIAAEVASALGADCQ